MFFSMDLGNDTVFFASAFIDDDHLAMVLASVITGVAVIICILNLIFDDDYFSRRKK